MAHVLETVVADEEGLHVWVVGHVGAVVPGLDFVHSEYNPIDVADLRTLLKIFLSHILRPYFLRSISWVSFFPTTVRIPSYNPFIFQGSVFML